MPPINHAAISVGVIAVSVVVAAGIAIYESPELRRIAENLRQRIALALHSLGDSISPQERENLFNRPEDAEGFLLSRGIDIRQGDQELDVDADEETRRRQREELMYWNALAESKRDQEKQDEKSEVEPRRIASRGSSFDHFLQKDGNDEKGAFVLNSGANAQSAEADGLRRRGEGARGLNYSVYTNPFADEHGIDETIAFENSLTEPEKDDMGDIYSVSHDGQGSRDRDTTATLSAPPEHIPSLVDIDTPIRQPVPAPSTTSERELGPDEFVTAGQEDRHEAYSSIQAWAQHSNPGFYSPLPISPVGPLSEAELISEGQLTPTDSVSLVGSGEDVGEEAHSSVGEPGRYYDVLSDDEGMMTPASWTEVGSVISESDTGAHPARA
ncbi:hypothetical protein BKA67DRAFT_653004 [Truncatella angustata]|uniref:Uncharacterized protein n=1 Tax=Truncatella angustata TaxID=152316 RepID=A0A9P8UXK8_9PEZI|nr:uncharacterized protein BKA67DRAFT_653004 [Truncatella angustata]KAH6659789.1 hypothetical protein BKA67DRAFT_653004 [Truncatella angustata]